MILSHASIVCMMAYTRIISCNIIGVLHDTHFVCTLNSYSAVRTRNAVRAYVPVTAECKSTVVVFIFAGHSWNSESVLIIRYDRRRIIDASKRSMQRCSSGSFVRLILSCTRHTSIPYCCSRKNLHIYACIYKSVEMYKIIAWETTRACARLTTAALQLLYIPVTLFRTTIDTTLFLSRVMHMISYTYTSLMRYRYHVHAWIG